MLGGAERAEELEIAAKHVGASTYTSGESSVKRHAVSLRLEAPAFRYGEYVTGRFLMLLEAAIICSLSPVFCQFVPEIRCRASG